MELRNPWTFASKLLSSESYGKQRENGYFYLCSLLWNAYNFSPFFFFFFPPSTFHLPTFRRFTFLACGLRAPGIPISIRFAERARTSTMGNGGLTHRWPTIASNTSSFAQWFHAPPCVDPRIRIRVKRIERHGRRVPRPRAYLSDNGQARILKDASTVTTSSMIPNVMYITPRCTRENM